MPWDLFHHPELQQEHALAHLLPAVQQVVAALQRCRVQHLQLWQSAANAASGTAWRAPVFEALRPMAACVQQLDLQVMGMTRDAMASLVATFPQLLMVHVRARCEPGSLSALYALPQLAHVILDYESIGPAEVAAFCRRAPRALNVIVHHFMDESEAVKLKRKLDRYHCRCTVSFE